MESVRNIRHPVSADNSLVFASLNDSKQTGNFVITNNAVDVSNGSFSAGRFAYDAASGFFTVASGTFDVLITLSITASTTDALSYVVQDSAGNTLTTSPTYSNQYHYYAKTRITNTAASGKAFSIIFTSGTAVVSGTITIYSATTLPSITYDNTYKLNFSTPISIRNISPNRALITDSTGLLSQSAVTSTELGYISGVTSAVQTQVDGKLSLSGGTMTGALALTNTVLRSNLPVLTIGNTSGGSNNTCGISMSPWSGRIGGPSTYILAIDDANASAHLLFYTASPGTANSAVERMRLTSLGNVGIGTTTVNTRLSITTATPEFKISLYDGTSNKSGFGYNATGLYYQVDSATLWHTFYVNGTTNRALQIGGAADPYINLSPTTTVYEARLNIQERAGLIATYYTSNTRLGGLYSIAGNHLTYNSLNDTIITTGFGPAVERMRIVGSTGRVGIGSSNPTTLLTVSGATSTFLTVQNTTGGSSCGLYLNTLSGRTGGVPTAITAVDDGNNSAHLTFSTAATGVATNTIVERMRIDSSGNVGIGTTSATTRLSITPSISEYKISLYDGTTNKAGFGYNSTIGTQYTVDTATLSHVFYSAGTTNKLMQVGGDANGPILMGPLTSWDSSRLCLMIGTNNYPAGFISFYTPGAQDNKIGSIFFDTTTLRYQSRYGFSFVYAPPSTADTAAPTMTIGTGVCIGGGYYPNTLLQLEGTASTGTSSALITLIGKSSSDVGLSMLSTDGTRSSQTPCAQVLTISDGNGSGHLIFSTAPTGSATTVVERMRVTNSGYVGIGAITPASLLHLHDSVASSPMLSISNSANNIVGIQLTPSSGRTGGYPVKLLAISDGSSSAHFTVSTAVTGAGAVERVRVQNNGWVGIGTTSPTSQLTISTSGTTTALVSGPTASWTGDDAINRFSGVYNSNTVASFYHSSNAAAQTYLRFMSGNNPIGGVSSTTAGQIQYNTTSDARLKENIVDLTSDNVACIDDVNVRVFNFKADESKTPVVGFIAQEIVDIIPQCVTVPSDPETGVYMMNEMRLIPYLVKAVQDLRRDNQDLRARLAALE